MALLFSIKMGFGDPCLGCSIVLHDVKLILNLLSLFPITYIEHHAFFR